MSLRATLGRLVNRPTRTAVVVHAHVAHINIHAKAWAAMCMRSSGMRAVRAGCRVAGALLALAILASPIHRAQAQEALDVPGYPPTIDGYDPREVAMLPKFCTFTQIFRDHVPGGSDRNELERWTAIMGATFNNMHHYCWGLMKTNRALFLVRDVDRRQFYLRDSITEFDYVIRGAPDDFILLPEILTKKGENLIRLRKGPLGIYALQRAAELKPDYWPPYAQMSDYYKSTGELEKARETLERGLSFVPDAQALLRRAAELKAGSDRKKATP